jgi:hypothetical protein
MEMLGSADELPNLIFIRRLDQKTFFHFKNQPPPIESSTVP